MSDINKVSAKPDRTLKSPFKFLAPYSAEDKNSFWGRDAEIQELYEMLFATNMVLLYGPSGTGKTSLVQCGLSKKFSGPDWIPLMIRRGEDFVTSLKEDLQEVSGLPENTSVPEHIIHIYNTYYRPVYLFFDQFEEIFTLADRDKNGKLILNAEGKLPEAKELFTIIRQLSNTLPCKVVFIFREEFLGQLYNYEQYLPNLFDFRLRVEPMNTVRINEVLEGSFAYYNISCNPPSVSQSISRNLLEGNATSQLAFLQVYLDQLWKTAYVKSYGEVEWTKVPPVVEITEQTLAKVGDVKKMLEVYLEEQEKSIADSIFVKRTRVHNLLDNFVTEDGTKRPIAEGSPRLNLNHELTEEQLAQCLNLLQEARLIRKDNQYYELAHDTLARILANKRTAAQRLIREITQILRTGYEFKQVGNGGFLNEEYVALYDQYYKEINDELESTKDRQGIIQYIEDSRRSNEDRKRNLEDKNQRLRQSLKKSRQFVATIGVLLLISIWTVYFAWLVNNNSTALYWASEVENISPGQGLLLLQSADSISSDKKVTNFIKKQTRKVFNANSEHHFREKMRFLDYLPWTGNQQLVSRNNYDDETEGFQVWDIESGKTLNSCSLEAGMRFKELSPDGKWMLISSADKKKYWVWDTDKKQKLTFLFNQKDSLFTRFSYAGKWLFTRNTEGMNLVWDLTQKKGLSYLDKEKGIGQVEFSRDGKWLLTKDEYGTYKVWETNRKKIPDFLSDEKDMSDVRFTTDSKWLLTTNSADEVKVWDLTKRQRADFLQAERPIKDALFSENGQWLYTLNGKGESRVWNTVDKSRHDFLKNEKGVFLRTFSPDGKWLFTKNADRQSFIWETAFGTKHDVFQGGKDIWNASISSDGRWFVTKNGNGKSSLWEKDRGEIGNFFNSEQLITDTRFSADGKFLFTTNTKGIFQKWELGNKKNEVFPLDKNVDYLAFSPNQAWYYVQKPGGSYRVFDTRTDSQHNFLEETEDCYFVEFSPDDNWVILVDSTGKYHLFNTYSDSPTNLLSKEKNIRAKFSADGKWLITIDKANNYRVWKMTREGAPDLQLAENNHTEAGLFADRKWNVTSDSAGTYSLQEVSLSKPDPLPTILNNTTKTLAAEYESTTFWHKVITKVISDDTTIVQTLYINTIPSQMQLVQNKYLYIVAGKALIKTDVETQKGNLFTFGDRQTHYFTNYEIKEWINVFGKEYLGELDQQTIDKYGVGKKFQIISDMLKTFWNKFTVSMSSLFGSKYP